MVSNEIILNTNKEFLKSKTASFNKEDKVMVSKTNTNNIYFDEVVETEDEINYLKHSKCTTEVYFNLKEFSPLYKIASTMAISRKSIINKTSIELNKLSLIKNNFQKLIEKSENFNLSNYSDLFDSDSDSEFSEDENKENLQVNKIQESIDEETSKKKKFELNYRKFYMPISENAIGNYDSYVTNSLKFIATFELNNLKLVQQIIEKTEIPEFSHNKILIVLDLDETLIHADIECKYDQHDVYLETDCGIIPLNIRPNLFEFLDFCFDRYELALFTASCSEYANPIIDFIEKDKKYFKLKLFRQHCVSYFNFYLKDLSIFNKDYKKIFLVDNCIYSFAGYLSNGILITSFYNDPEDIDLLSLIEFFKYNLEKTDDVRDEIEKMFEFNKKLNMIKAN